MEKNQILATLAENLKKLLNQFELSPSELARRCDISAGSISKIIKGTMSITIPKAMNIAEGLGVSLPELLDGLTVEAKNELIKKKEPTKTEWLSVGVLSLNNKRITCVKNYRGKIIGTSELESGLDLAESSSSLLQAIQESIFEACPNIETNHSKLKAIKLNLVTQSFEFEETRNKFAFFAQKHFNEVTLLADWQISYLASFKNAHGISLIIDKGVSLSYMHNRKLKKLGGWKFPVYDLGGENWLGVETIRHTIEAKEGYIPMSGLAHNVLAKFNGKIEKITEMCFKRDNADIYCLFAEPLYRNYFTGDPAAKAIIERGFKLVHQSVERVDAILGKKTKISLSGLLVDIYRPFFNKERLTTSPSEADKASLLADVSKETLAELV